MKHQISLAVIFLFVACFIANHADAAELAKTDSRLGGDFKLTDHNGHAFALSQLRGQVVLIFFGYTFCPDICPTELASLASVLRTLRAQGHDNIKALFITLDPARDTPEKLKDYVRFFHPDLIGLTGTRSEIEGVANRYRVRFQRQQGMESYYTVDHTTNLYVIDSEGAVAALVPYGLPPEHVIRVASKILN